MRVLLEHSSEPASQLATNSCSCSLGKWLAGLIKRKLKGNTLYCAKAGFWIHLKWATGEIHDIRTVEQASLMKASFLFLYCSGLHYWRSGQRRRRRKEEGGRRRKRSRQHTQIHLGQFIATTATDLQPFILLCLDSCAAGSQSWAVLSVSEVSQASVSYSLLCFEFHQQPSRKLLSIRLATQQQYHHQQQPQRRPAWESPHSIPTRLANQNSMTNVGRPLICQTGTGVGVGVG